MIERPRSRPSWTPSASESAVLFGISEGGPAAIVFAATRPERTRALILAGTFSFTGAMGWDDVERDPAELRARLVPELGEDYMPSTEQIARWFRKSAAPSARRGAAVRLLSMHCAVSVRSITPSSPCVERMCASPGMARATLEAVVPDRRAADPADDHRANPGHPCPRGPRHPGAGRPVSCRPHPRRAVCSRSTARTTRPGSAIPTGS